MQDRKLRKGKLLQAATVGVGSWRVSTVAASIGGIDIILWHWLLALRFSLLALRDVVLHLPQRVEQLPRQHDAAYLQQRHEQRGARHRRADDLGVHWGHFSTTEPFVGLLVGELAGGAVVAVEAARQRQVVPPAPVVARVVGAAAAQLALDLAESFEHIGVGLRVVVSIVHCILDESVRVLSINVHEDEDGGDQLQHHDEHEEQPEQAEHAAALPVGAAPSTEGDHEDEDSREDEQPWRYLGPVDPVVQQVVVAVPEADELSELHKEPDARGCGDEAEHRVDNVHNIENVFDKLVFPHGEVRARVRLTTEWEACASRNYFYKLWPRLALRERSLRSQAISRTCQA